MSESQKIREAEYFLAQMDRERENAEHFGHNLSAFLSSARSVLQYALEEAKPKPGGLAWYDGTMSGVARTPCNGGTWRRS